MIHPIPGQADRGSIVRKLLVSLALMAAIGGAGYLIAEGIIASKLEAERVETTTPGHTVEVFTLEREDYRQILTGYGTARAVRTATLSAEVGGRIAAMDESIRIGSEIKQGQLLVRIESEAYSEERNRRQALLNQAQSELKRLEAEKTNLDQRLAVAEESMLLAEEETGRQEQLRKEGAGNAKARDIARIAYLLSHRTYLQIQNQDLTREYDIKRTRTLIDERKAEAEIALLNVARCEIHAPFAGRLAERMVEPGEFVAPGEVLCRLTDNSIVEIPIQLPASEIGAISIGAKVEIRLPRQRDQQWAGEIIRRSPEVDTLNRTVAIFVMVDNQRLTTPLLPGELVESRIEGRLYPSTIVIPRRAMIDGFAFVKTGDRARRRRPTVIRALGDDLLIADGLEAGDDLIVSNLEILFDGSKVVTSGELNEQLRRQQFEGAELNTPATP